VPTNLENVFYNDTTVKTQVGATIEYNMNSLIDNLTVTSTIADTAYTNAITNWTTGKPNPFKKLFPIDSIIKPFRPINSGVNYYILGPDQQEGTSLNFYSPKRVIYPIDKARVYYPGVTTSYKYWVGPKNANIDITVNYVNSVNTKPAISNKLVIAFDKFHTLPTSVAVDITYSNNSVKSTSLPNFNTNFPDGRVMLYPTATDTNWITVVPETLYELSKQIKSVKVTGTNSSGTVAVIEISARWIKDISSDIVSLDIQKESSASSSDILPVGNVTANTINLILSKYNQASLQIESYNRASTSFDASKIYIAKNVEIKPHFKVYHALGSITSGSDKYDKIEQGSYFVDSWNISSHGDTSITALDGSKYLMETLCPDLLLEGYPVTAILRSLLDVIGFTNYNFNVVTTDSKVTDTSVPMINYWWTSPEDTVWETIQDLCRDIQMNAFFDESNVLQFYSREYMYNRTTADWNFYYEKEGSVLPNIIDFFKEEIASANQVKVLWSTPITSSSTGSSGGLWTSPTTFLAGGGLKYDIAANTSAAQTVLIIEISSSESYSNIQSLFNFNGYLLIDSEIIEYDAIRYQYVPKDSATNTYESVWIESKSDIDKYRYLSKTGYAVAGKFETAYFRPTGEYRVKTRGALGTTPAFHAASAINKLSQWSGREVIWT
jgi:hypothetical protein